MTGCYRPRPRVNIDAISKKGPLGLTWQGRPIEQCDKFQLQAMIQHQAGIIEGLNEEKRNRVEYLRGLDAAGYRLRLEPTRVNWRVLGLFFGGMAAITAVFYVLIRLGVIP